MQKELKGGLIYAPAGMPAAARNHPPTRHTPIRPSQPRTTSLGPTIWKPAPVYSGISGSLQISRTCAARQLGQGEQDAVGWQTGCQAAMPSSPLSQKRSAESPRGGFQLLLYPTAARSRLPPPRTSCSWGVVASTNCR